MLILIDAANGPECINPAMITRIQIMRDGAAIIWPDGGMSYVLRSEWERIKPMLVKPQSGFEASAEDNNTSSTYDGLPF